MDQIDAYLAVIVASLLPIFVAIISFILKKNPKKKCIIGLVAEPKRLAEIRRNRMNSLNETGNKKSVSYTHLTLPTKA